MVRSSPSGSLANLCLRKTHYKSFMVRMVSYHNHTINFYGICNMVELWYFTIVNSGTYGRILWYVLW